MVLAANRGSVVISQQVRPFAWSNFDPVTRTKVITVESGLGALTPDTITPFSTNSVGPQLAALGPTAPASGTWDSANRARFFPFSVTEPVTVYKLFVVNGSVVSGNIDIGIYDDAGTLLISAGSTAQAGTSTIQSVNVTDTELDTGRHFLAFVISNTTGTTYRAAPTIAPRAHGMFIQDTALPLPSTFTPASSGVAAFYVPIFGAALRSDF